MEYGSFLQANIVDWEQCYGISTKADKCDARQTTLTNFIFNFSLNFLFYFVLYKLFRYSNFSDH